MRGKILRKGFYNNKIIDELGELGEIAWFDHNINTEIHVGDIVLIDDGFRRPTTSIVVKQADGYQVYKYFDTLAGLYCKQDINLQIVRKYYELKDKERIGDLTIQIDSYDLEQYAKMEEKEIKKHLSTYDRLSMIELELNPLLEKVNNLSTTDSEKLKKLSTEYSFLYDKLKDETDINEQKIKGY